MNICCKFEDLWTFGPVIIGDANLPPPPPPPPRLLNMRRAIELAHAVTHLKLLSCVIHRAHKLHTFHVVKNQLISITTITTYCITFVVNISRQAKLPAVI